MSRAHEGSGSSSGSTTQARFGISVIRTTRQDLRFAVRQLSKSPSQKVCRKVQFRNTDQMIGKIAGIEDCRQKLTSHHRSVLTQAAVIPVSWHRAMPISPRDAWSLDRSWRRSLAGQ
jgi:hypothetical protein